MGLSGPLIFLSPDPDTLESHEFSMACSALPANTGTQRQAGAAGRQAGTQAGRQRQAEVGRGKGRQSQAKQAKASKGKAERSRERQREAKREYVYVGVSCEPPALGV